MSTSIIPIERIEQAILLIRGQKVMLDFDLARLYGVETGALNRAVARNRRRFPRDFVFQRTEQEIDNLKCEFGISSWGGRRRSRPYAFTEQGVAMLSSVLRSPQAEPKRPPTGYATEERGRGQAKQVIPSVDGKARRKLPARI